MIIKDIKLNSNKILRVSRDIVNDISYFQMRHWTRNVNNKNFSPTEKFIVMNSNKVVELIPYLIISMGNSGNIMYE